MLFVASVTCNSLSVRYFCFVPLVWNPFPWMAVPYSVDWENRTDVLGLKIRCAVEKTASSASSLLQMSLVRALMLPSKTAAQCGIYRLRNVAVFITKCKLPILAVRLTPPILRVATFMIWAFTLRTRSGGNTDPVTVSANRNRLFTTALCVIWSAPTSSPQ